VIVRFVDIGVIVDHLCLELIVCFVDIGGIVDHSTEQTEHKKMHAIYRGKLMFLLEPGKKRWRGNV
jgi:hypothetical protein